MPPVVVKVESVNELKKFIALGHNEYFVSFGCARSSKFITLESDDKFYVLNYIDSTEEYMTEQELIESNIGKAIQKGMFYAW
jgi:hypothetical protein